MYKFEDMSGSFCHALGCDIADVPELIREVHTQIPGHENVHFSSLLTGSSVRSDTGSSDPDRDTLQRKRLVPHNGAAP